MRPRSDGKPFDREAEVDPALCLSCGICAGACPTATPFRRASALSAGIELPHAPLVALREAIDGKAVESTGVPFVVLCEHSVRPEALVGTAMATVPCIGALPPERKEIVTLNFHCSPCRHRFFKECAPSPHNKPYCIEDISVSQVSDAVDRLLKRLG